MRQQESFRRETILSAGFSSYYPEFRESLPQILRVLTARGDAYTPDMVSLISTFSSRTLEFDPRQIGELSSKWEGEDPGRTFWKFEKKGDPVLSVTVGDTKVLYNTLLLMINRESLRRDRDLRVLLELLTDLYNVIHPFYGAVWIREMEQKVDSPLGRVSPGWNLREGLPGIEWATFMGPEYVEMFGAERLFSAPYNSAKKLYDGGALLLLSPSPFDYSSNKPELDKRRFEITKHLGSEAFLARDPSSKRTVPKFRYEEQWNADQKKFFESHPINQGILFDASRDKWENWVKNNQAISSTFVSEMGEKGLTLDYSEASLDHLDEYIERSHETKERSSIEFAEQLGAYLAQVMIKRTGAEWWFPEAEKLPSLKIDGIILTPLARAVKVFEEGEKLGQWYRTISKTIGVLGTPRLSENGI